MLTFKTEVRTQFYKPMSPDLINKFVRKICIRTIFTFNDTNVKCRYFEDKIKHLEHIFYGNYMA